MLRLPGLTSCLTLCAKGSLVHVGLLSGSCLTVQLSVPRSLSKSLCGMFVLISWFKTI